ncbi:MAG TPA: hypothetical protein VIF62_07880 [Labilithrix sp.]|jgi:hypothetical protein
MKTIARVTGLLVLGVVAAGGAAAVGCGDPFEDGAAQPSAETVDEKLAQDIAPPAMGGVMIQPVKVQDGIVQPFQSVKGWQFLPKQQDGSYQGIFTTMLKTSGIQPCTTRPNALSGNPGFLELITEGNSMVLNATGSRATFGYWVTASTGKAWFVLFSYDHVADPQTNVCICAEEVFVFGPMTFDVDHVPVPNPPQLIDGLAVNGADGKLLAAVPLTIADAFNYEGGGPYLDGSKSKPKGTAVTPGVAANGTGCRLCHGTNVDAMPQSTRAFPWFAVPTTDGGAPDGGAPDADAGSTSK